MKHEDPDCEHEWEDGGTLVLTGAPIMRCTKCPRWRTRYVLPDRPSRTEVTRRSMEETSRHLGEHRDV